MFIDGKDEKVRKNSSIDDKEILQMRIIYSIRKSTAIKDTLEIFCFVPSLVASPSIAFRS